MMVSEFNIDKEIDLWTQIAEATLRHSERKGVDEIFKHQCTTIIDCANRIVRDMETVRKITNLCDCPNCNPVMH